MKTENKEAVVIKFAGDSGDGMQLLGYQFTSSAALAGNDTSNFPDFPAEIRAPKGTLSGVSGFQLQFGSKTIDTPGDEYDVLVAMNAAALKTNLQRLKQGGVIITDTAGFEGRSMQLAGYTDNPLEDQSLDMYSIYEVDVTKHTRDVLADSGLERKIADRSRNFYVLGILYWMYNRSLQYTIDFMSDKFAGKPEVLAANINVLKAGYSFAETSEIFSSRTEVNPAPMPKGDYRGIMGNQGLALGLVTAAEKAGLSLFYGSYPITPASEILHALANYKHFGVKTFQAEDEIAAVCSAIGAAYAGGLAVCGTSGPGMALKAEALGLAVMLEVPLVVVNVQRGGPSTGLPTKTEQSDLLQAIYGRNGESPLVVLACASPSDAFETTFEACRIAIENMTPVILLSDGYIANGAEPWRYPKAADIRSIHARMAEAKQNGDPFMPYERDENLVRAWAIPGTKGLQHRVGGLEKEDITGDVSFEGENHEHMVKLRQARIDGIANQIPEQKISSGSADAKVAVLGWGSTYGTIKAAVQDLQTEGQSVCHVHVRYLNPMPKNLNVLLAGFEKIIIPEINNGQLIKLIRERFLIDAVGFNKIKGLPFTVKEMKDKIREVCLS